MKEIKRHPVILVDSREQLPYEFGGANTVVRKLYAGDYSLEGYSECVAVERKTLQDAYGCVGGSRSRFTCCLERLGQIQRPCVVIESTLAEFCNPPPRTRITPAQAVGSYISWSCQYRIPVFWCGTRAHAERVTLRFLMAYWKHVVNGGGG